MNGCVITPMLCTCVLRDSCRATVFGLKPNSAITFNTSLRVSGVTLGLLFSTRETVPTPTPAFCATSIIVGRAIKRTNPYCIQAWKRFHAAFLVYKVFDACQQTD